MYGNKIYMRWMRILVIQNPFFNSIAFTEVYFFSGTGIFLPFVIVKEKRSMLFTYRGFTR